MSKKKGEYSVLSEVNSEEEWLSLCSKEGLTVVDVYSEWSGPCSAMTNFLKKVKLEVNDDLLSYAMAKADAIPQLKAFQGQCKPIWLFMASGEPVAVVHGANAPLLGKMIQNEMYKERMAMRGEMKRRIIKLEEAVPRSSFGTVRRRRSASNNLNPEEDEDEDEEDDAFGTDPNAYECLKELRCDEFLQRPKHQIQESRNFTLLLVEEYISEEEGNTMAILEKLKSVGIKIMRKKTVTLAQGDALMFISGSCLRSQHVTSLIGTKCCLLLLRCEETMDAAEQVTKLLGPLEIDDEGEIVPPSSPCLRQHFYNEEEFAVGFLVPDYQGFLKLMDKFFVERLKRQYKERQKEEEASAMLFLFNAQTWERANEEVDSAQMEVLAQTDVGSLQLDQELVDKLLGLLESQNSTHDEDRTHAVKFLKEESAKMLGVPVFAFLCPAESGVKSLRALEPLVVTRDPDAIRCFFSDFGKKEQVEQTKEE